jgi:adenine C2-methylase RlmN of 23S rRNA A2503 and tRNA A37
MNCRFCCTTKIDLKGIVKIVDIVEQLVIVARMCNQELGLDVVMNVMFMDMGNPFRILII